MCRLRCDILQTPSGHEITDFTCPEIEEEERRKELERMKTAEIKEEIPHEPLTAKEKEFLHNFRRYSFLYFSLFTYSSNPSQHFPHNVFSL